MARFPDLPVEVVERIIEHIHMQPVDMTQILATSPFNQYEILRDAELSHNGLRNLASTCTSLRLLLHPHLRRMVFISGKNTFQQMVRLLRQLDERPEVRQQTTQFYVHHEIRDDAGYSRLTEDDRDFIKLTPVMGLRSLFAGDEWRCEEIKEPNFIKRHLGHRPWRATRSKLRLLAKLILLRLPRLEGVGLPWFMQNWEVYRNHSIRWASDLCRLEEARRGRVHVVHRPRRLHFRCPWGVLYKTQRAMTDYHCFRTDGLDTSMYLVSMVTRLVLDAPKLRHHAFEGYIRHFEGLETLVIKNEWQKSQVTAWWIVEVLGRHQARTLKTLWIDIRNQSTRLPRRITSFEGLANLSSLRVTDREVVRNVPVLVSPGQPQGLRTLPKSLRRLHIAGSGKELRRDLKWLEDAVVEGRFPNLKEVATAPWLGAWDPYAMNRKRLHEAGVNLLFQADSSYW